MSRTAPLIPGALGMGGAYAPAMSRGPGALQRRIIDLLRPAPDAEARVESTTYLADRLLGRTDREAVRQVRRAVDSLAARGLVETWTAPAEDARYSKDPDVVRLYSRRYLRPTRNTGRYCGGEGCRLCAEHGPPKGRTDDGRPLHLVAEVHADKSRMRWVAYAMTARPRDERLALLAARIDSYRAALAERHPNGEPPTVPPNLRSSLAAIGAVMAHEDYVRLRHGLAANEAEHAALLADADAPA